MPVIDLTPGLTGPLPWVPGLPLVLRILLLLAVVGAALLGVAGTHRRTGVGRRAGGPQ